MCIPNSYWNNSLLYRLSFNIIYNFFSLYLHPSLHSMSFSPILQCWMSAILPPVLLFRDKADGGLSIKSHQATLPLAVHHLYSDWLARRGLEALLFSVTFPADPKVLTSPATHTHTGTRAYTHARLCIKKIFIMKLLVWMLNFNEAKQNIEFIFHFK